MPSKSTPDVGLGGSPRTRLWTATLTICLMTAMFVSTFPQYAIGVLAPVFVEELGITAGILGIVASVMYLSAALIARGIGRGVDAVGGRTGLVALFAASVGSLLVLALTRSLTLLVIAALLSGAAMAMNNPVTNRLVVLHVPRGQRGLVMGVKQGGVKLAHLTSGAVLPAFVLTIGWRSGLLVVGAAVAALLSASVWIVPRQVGGPSRMRGKLPADIRAQILWLQLVAGLLAVGMTSLTTYLALYAVEAVGTSLTVAGLVVAALGLTAVIARIIWATLTERFADPTLVLLVISGGGAIGLLLIGTAATIGPQMLWVGAIFTAATAGSFNVVVQLVVVTRVDPKRSAATSGAVQGAFLIGLATGAPLFGGIVEATGGYTVSWSLAALAAVAAFGVVLGERHRTAGKSTQDRST